MKRAIAKYQRWLLVGLVAFGLLGSALNAQSTRVVTLLHDTDWKLTHLEGKVVALAEKEQVPSLMFQSGQNRVTGFTGCNRLNGVYKMKHGEMKISRLSVTKMACIQGTELEGAFLKVLEKVRAWKTFERQLELSDAAGAILARFEMRVAK